MVERSNLVQNGQIHEASCLKMHFVCILLYFASTSKNKKCPVYVGESCEANKNGPVPSVALSQRAELSWHALNSGHDGGLFADAVSSFLLSLPFFFFFSLSPPLLSPFLFSKTDLDLGKHAPGRQPCGWYGGLLGLICGLWARVKHSCCAQKPQNRSPGEAKTQNLTKSSVA